MIILPAAAPNKNKHKYKVIPTKKPVGPETGFISTTCTGYCQGYSCSILLVKYVKWITLVLCFV